MKKSNIEAKRITTGVFVMMAVACFGLSPAPNAFGVSLPQDGGYPNGNAAEGYGALSILSTGTTYTAIGSVCIGTNCLRRSW
jgi:hypothetical protein